MSSRVCATRHIKDPVPLIEKSRALCPGVRFTLSYLHQAIIITQQLKLNREQKYSYKEWKYHWPSILTLTPRGRKFIKFCGTDLMIFVTLALVHIYKGRQNESTGAQM